MWHESENVSLAIADARDVLNRPIWICFWHNTTLAIGIPQDHLIICVQLTQCRGVCEETTFAMRYW